MRLSLSVCRLLLMTIFFVAGCIQVQAQKKATTLTQDQLYSTITKLDSSLFAAFNTCDIQKYRAHFADDLEFYHDKEGLIAPLNKLMKGFENGLCKPGGQWKSRRAAVPGSLKVYPMDNYGAILVGEHTFYETELATGKEYERSTAKFTLLFQEVDGVWKIKRALSYDHQMPR